MNKIHEHLFTNRNFLCIKNIYKNYKTCFLFFFLFFKNQIWVFRAFCILMILFWLVIKGWVHFICDRDSISNKKLGFNINWRKSVLVVSQVILYLSNGISWLHANLKFLSQLSAKFQTCLYSSLRGVDYKTTGLMDWRVTNISCNKLHWV